MPIRPTVPGLTSLPASGEGVQGHSGKIIANTSGLAGRNLRLDEDSARRLVAASDPPVIRHGILGRLKAGASQTLPESMQASDETDKPWVGVSLTRTAYAFAPQELKVRKKGIFSQRDIEIAVAYLQKLAEQGLRSQHPDLSAFFSSSFREIIREINHGTFLITIDETATVSSAQSTFGGRIERGHEGAIAKRQVTLRPGAGIDELFHELLHCTPLRDIKALFPDVIYPPAVDASAPYLDTVAAIRTNMRLNEAISFSGMCVLYKIEKRLGLMPQFDSTMMAEIFQMYCAQGVNGVMAAFDKLLPHYEIREGRLAVLFATIVQLDGDKDRDFDEIIKLVGPDFFSENPVKANEALTAFLQKHFDDYLIKLGLAGERVVDLNKIQAQLCRQPGVSLISAADVILAPAIAIALDTVDKLVNQDFTLAGSASLAPTTPQKPLDTNHSLLGQSYYQVVEALLATPPKQIKREEFAALVSFARLAPNAILEALLERLYPFVDASTGDLALALGLILCERGFKVAGKKWVMQFFDLPTMATWLPLIAGELGRDTAFDLVATGLKKKLNQIEGRANQDAGIHLSKLMFETPIGAKRTLELFKTGFVASSAYWEKAWPVLSSYRDMDYTDEKTTYGFNLYASTRWLELVEVHAQLTKLAQTDARFAPYRDQVGRVLEQQIIAHATAFKKYLKLPGCKSGAVALVEAEWIGFFVLADDALVMDSLVHLSADDRSLLLKLIQGARGDTLKMSHVKAGLKRFGSDVIWQTLKNHVAKNKIILIDEPLEFMPLLDEVKDVLDQVMATIMGITVQKASEEAFDEFILWLKLADKVAGIDHQSLWQRIGQELEAFNQQHLKKDKHVSPDDAAAYLERILDFVYIATRRSDESAALKFRDLAAGFAIDAKKIEGYDTQTAAWQVAAATALISPAAHQDFLRRVEDEILRGGAVTTGLLTECATRSMELGFSDLAHEFYKLMILRVTVNPNQYELKDTYAAIHNSGLSEAIRDDLLFELTSRVRVLIRGIASADLSIVNKALGFVPWRIADVVREKAPHYAKTEELIIEIAADVPELVDSNVHKNTLMRLSVFGAVGLPLQRREVALRQTIQSSGVTLWRRSQVKERSQLLRDVGLPSNWDIPAVMDEASVTAFWTAHKPTLLSVLIGSRPELIAAGLGLLSQITFAAIRGNKKPATHFNELGELVTRLANSHPQTTTELIKTVFAGLPESFNAREFALNLHNTLTSRDLRRLVFDLYTTKMNLGGYARERLASARANPNEVDEREFCGRYLAIEHSRHAMGVIADELLEAIETDAQIRAAYEEYLRKKHTNDPMILADVRYGKQESDDRWYEKRETNFTARLAEVGEAFAFLSRYALESAGLIFVESGQGKGRSFNFYADSTVLQKLKLDVTSESSDDCALIDTAAVILRHSSLARKMFRGDRTEWDIKLGRFVNLKERQLLNDLALETKELCNQAQSILPALEMKNVKRVVNDPIIAPIIKNRSGWERDLIIYIFTALSLSERSLLGKLLETAHTDEDRLLAVGKVAHLEKLMQLASIHPAVPLEYQIRCAVFQDQVPPRDTIDVLQTLAHLTFARGYVPIDIDVAHPISEGTIGGVYPAEDRRVAKIIPEGKEADLDRSLEIIATVQRLISSLGLERPGARSIFDLLSFYTRAMREELDLSREIGNAEALRKILPSNFIVPTYDEAYIFSNLAVMNRLDGKRLDHQDMTQESKDDAVALIDTVVLTMLFSGVIHYDLHPGNIAVDDRGNIIFYDTGRVVIISPADMAKIQQVYFSMQAGGLDAQGFKRALASFGAVHNKDKFATVTEIFTPESLTDPFEFIEKNYAKLGDYAFTPHDNIVKILLMFLTWRGTKRKLGQAG